MALCTSFGRYSLKLIQVYPTTSTTTCCGAVAGPAVTTLLQPTNQLMKDIQIRTRVNNKHWNPKFKWLRAKKFIKVDLPDFDEKLDTMPKEKIKSRMKERGILPPRLWMERPFFLSCTGGPFEVYVPPEGDGKMSIVSTGGAKQTLQFLEKKSKSMLAVRKIRSYEEDFDPIQFAATTAQDVYVQAHQMMMDKNKLKLREYVTERAYPEITNNIKYTTIHWKFLKSLEPPRVVHARCTDIITKENIFAQITVRFHTQQLLAIYDRFGRLMHGSEILAKDVLEYIIFEKHISNEYGVWRLHDKIIPDWLPSRQPSAKTCRIDDEPPTPPPSSSSSLEVVKKDTNSGDSKQQSDLVASNNSSDRKVISA